MLVVVADLAQEVDCHLAGVVGNHSGVVYYCVLACDCSAEIDLLESQHQTDVVGHLVDPGIEGCHFA